MIPPAPAPESIRSSQVGWPNQSSAGPAARSAGFPVGQSAARLALGEVTCGLWQDWGVLGHSEDQQGDVVVWFLGESVQERVGE